jgi:di/tricarboxylate transporter
MAELGWQAWFTLLTLGGVVYLLFSGKVTAEIATLAGLGALLLAGAVDLEAGLAGFSNRGVITIGLLFVAAALLRKSGGLELVTRHLFAETKSLRYGVLRMMAPTAVMSAFLNNTPVVALLLPGAKSWATRNHHPPSRVLMPLSFAAILGGTCTLIGTSTNLVVNGLLNESGLRPLSFFEIGFVGGPIALLGIAYLATVGPRLLPDRQSEATFDDPTTFTTEAVVLDDGSLDGTALTDAEVGDLHGLYPVEVRRGEVLIPAPQPDLVLQAGDRLVLAGAAAQFVRLHRSKDLATTSNHQFELSPPVASRRRVVEVVLSDHCPLIGSTVGEGTFRRHYGAAVIAVSRAGDRVLSENVGDWKLRVGDRLLLEAGDGFESHRDSRDFFVVTELSDFTDGPARWRGWLSILAAVGMVVAAATGVTSLLQAAVAAVALMYVLNPVSGRELRDAVDWQVILTIGAAFGIAAAVEQTGLASVLAERVIFAGGSNPWIALAAVYVVTAAMTELVTNNAAAALSFPLAVAVASALDVSATPFAIAVMIAASASFMGPLGYQTNLMVYGAGNYHASDFFKAGWPLALLCAVVTIALTPFVFPF